MYCIICKAFAHVKPSNCHSYVLEQNHDSMPSVIMLWVLWLCRLGVRKIIRRVKIEWWGVDKVICLERGADCIIVQLMSMHPKTPTSLASFKSRLVLPFWHRLTQVVVEKRSLNGCRSSNHKTMGGPVPDYCQSPVAIIYPSPLTYARQTYHSQPLQSRHDGNYFACYQYGSFLFFLLQKLCQITWLLTGWKKISLLPEAPLWPEARGICHICHMANPALGRATYDSVVWNELRRDSRCCDGAALLPRYLWSSPDFCNIQQSNVVHLSHTEKPPSTQHMKLGAQVEVLQGCCWKMTRWLPRR